MDNIYKLRAWLSNHYLQLSVIDSQQVNAPQIQILGLFTLGKFLLFGNFDEDKFMCRDTSYSPWKTVQNAVYFGITTEGGNGVNGKAKHWRSHSGHCSQNKKKDTERRDKGTATNLVSGVFYLNDSYLVNQN